MTEPLNPKKSKQLRPLRIILAVLMVILVILILDRLPTSVKDRAWNHQATEKHETPEGAKYYYFNGFLDILENQTEDRLKKLGVPEEEYQKLTEYLSKDEVFVLEAKVLLASELESVYVEADEDGIKDLKKIFNLDEDYSFDRFKQLETAPNDYKILSDLLTDYHQTLNTIEDYDIIEE